MKLTRKHYEEYKRLVLESDEKLTLMRQQRDEYAAVNHGLMTKNAELTDKLIDKENYIIHLEELLNYFTAVDNSQAEE